MKRATLTTTFVLAGIMAASAALPAQYSQNEHDRAKYQQERHDARHHTKAKIVGGSAAGGAVVGGLLGGGKGALIGAGVGAGGGLVANHEHDKHEDKAPGGCNSPPRELLCQRDE